MEVLSVSEAKSRFSDLISRAANGTSFLIQRRQRPVAVVLSAAEHRRLERASHLARELAFALGQSREVLEEIDSGRTHPAMAAYGLWQDDPSLAALESEVAEPQGRYDGELK